MRILGRLQAECGRKPVTAMALRDELGALRRQHAATIAQRDGLALQAIQSSAAGVEWERRDEAAHVAAQRIAVLEVAIPRAEALERAAAARAEAARRELARVGYDRAEAEARAWASGVLARLPSGTELTRARDLRDRLRALAADVDAPRATDPLAQIYDGCAARIHAVKRAIWSPKDPIRLEGDSDLVVAARARVAAAVKGEKS